MKKIPFHLAKGVSNIELFYDLIFVYRISVITGVLHHPEGVFMRFDPIITLICDTIVVWAALGHEWQLYRMRTAIAERAEELGYDKEKAIDHLDELLATSEGQRKLAEYEHLTMRASRGDE